MDMGKALSIFLEDWKAKSKLLEPERNEKKFKKINFMYF